PRAAGGALRPAPPARSPAPALFPQPLFLQPQERQGQQRQGRVVVPAHPATRLIPVQAALPLGRLDVLLDRPATATHRRQLLQSHRGRGVRAVVLQLRLLGDTAPHQESLLRTRPTSLAEPYLHRGILVDAWPLAALGHGHASPRLGRQGGDYRINPLGRADDQRLGAGPAATPGSGPLFGWDDPWLFGPDPRVGGGIDHVPLAQLAHSLDERRA